MRSAMHFLQRIAVVLALGVGVMPPAAAATGSLAYPIARPGTVVDTFHGVRVADPYRWLESLDSTDTLQWVEAQNRFSAGLLDEGNKDAKLRARLVELGDTWPDDGVPLVAGGREFFLGLDATRSHPALFAKEAAGSTPRLLLDPVSIDDKTTITTFAPSPDGRWIAITLSDNGSDWGRIRVIDVDSGKLLPEMLAGVWFSGSVKWAADGLGFLYRRHDQKKLRAKDAHVADASIHRHRVGTAQSVDVLVYDLPAADAVDKNLDIAISSDLRRLFLSIERGPFLDFLGGSKRQVSTLPLAVDGTLANADPPRQLTVQASAYRVIATEGERVFVMTDLGAPRRRLVSIDMAANGAPAWQTVIPETDAVLESVQYLGGKFFAMYQQDVHSVMRVHDRQGKRLADIELPDLGTASNVEGSAGSNVFRFMFTSFLYPTVILRHDMGTGITTVEGRGKTTVDVAAYQTEQRWFTSKDGTRVPMFIVHRRGITLDGSHPTILYGYGASGTSTLPGFSEDVFAWLEMGGIYAVANIRGGGEFGKAWYEAAILERKQNSFDDFIAASEYLVDEGFTSPRKLAIRGRSAGGLLVTTVLTQRPDLFALVLADVPATDAVRRSRSGTGAIQRGQWGSTDDPVQFKAMFAYSPLHNLRRGTCYPATLVTTSRDDDRSPPWHSYKFVAALQAAQGCDQPILLHVRDKGAHGGAADLDQMFDGMTMMLGFTARQLGLGASP